MYHVICYMLHASCYMFLPLLLYHPPPRLELRHVFEEQHTGLSGTRHAHHDPRQATDLLAHGLAALGPAVVGAVRRKPRHLHVTGRQVQVRVHVPHVHRHMAGRRVVERVNGDGVLAMVDGHVGRAAERLLDARRGASRTGEVVEHEAAPGQRGHGLGKEERLILVPERHGLLHTAAHVAPAHRVSRTAAR